MAVCRIYAPSCAVEQVFDNSQRVGRSVVNVESDECSSGYVRVLSNSVFDYSTYKSTDVLYLTLLSSAHCLILLSCLGCSLAIFQSRDELVPRHVLVHPLCLHSGATRSYLICLHDLK